MRRFYGMWLLILMMGTAPVWAGGKEERLLTVSGSGKEQVTAEVADVRLGMEVRGQLALEVQKQLAEKMVPVVAMVREGPVEQVQLGQVTIYPEYDTRPRRELLGYRGELSLSFSCPVEQAGELIDRAIEAGANKVHGILVRPTAEASERARKEALKKGALAALEEARLLLGVLGLDEVGVVSITVNPSHSPHYPMYKAAAFESGASRAALEIHAEEQTVSANVQLQVAFDL